MPLRSHLLLPSLANPLNQKLESKRLSIKVLASKREGGHGNDRYKRGELVDRGMIVLRERIHEIKAAERKSEAPSGWMEWEKQYLANYDSDICEAMGLLQTLLMNTRPSLAIGLIVVIALSVPISVAAIAFSLVDIVKLIG